MSLVTLIILALINNLQSVEYKRNLTVTNSEHSGIHITSNPLHVDTSNNIWHINPTSQNGYDLELVLENEWTFNPSMESQLTLTLNGFTPNVAKEDGEFIIIFSVDNTEYFAVVIRLDTQRNTWKYYPPISTDSNSFIIINDIFSNIIDTNTQNSNRWRRISNSTEIIDNWVNVRPFHKDELEWPLNIKLINNPITNRLLYECNIKNENNNKLLQFEYLRAFSSDKTIKIYILNDADDNKPFDISWIYIQYNDNNTINISDFSTTINKETETSNISGTEITSYILPTSGPIMKEELPSFPSIKNEKIEIGVMIGIVIGIVFVIVCIIVFVFLYFKKKEEENNPKSLNRSEYHTPKVNMSTTEISDVLEKKRRESQQFAENNMLKKRKLSQSNNNINNGQIHTQSIVPIDDSDSLSDEDIYTDTNTENDDDSKFNED